MKIKGQFQWTDYLAAQMLHMQPSGFARIVQYGAYSFVALAFVAILCLFFIGRPGVDIGFVLLIFILSVSFPLQSYFYRYVFLPNRVKKIFAQQKELSLPFEIEFTETDMKTSNELGNSTRPWTYFTKWKENEELIILYTSDAMFTMIAKRLFADPQQIEMVKSFLEKNKVAKAKSRFT